MKKLVLALALALVALSPLVAAPLGKKELKELKAKLGAALNSGDWDAAGEHLVFWEECYQVSRAITGTGDAGPNAVPTQLEAASAAS